MDGEPSSQYVCVRVYLLSHVCIFVSPWTIAYQAPLSMEFSRQAQWLLLLLLSRFSRVRLCATPQTAAHQAPLSLWWVAISFSRRSSQPNDWTQVSCTAGRFFTVWATWRAPSQCVCVLFVHLCPTVYDPMSASSVHGILQARILEWVAISFSRSLTVRVNNSIMFLAKKVCLLNG